MDFNVTFLPINGVEIPAAVTLADLVRQCGFTNQFPPVEQWGYEVTKRGSRELAIAQFSRDMWWECEVDLVYEHLINRQYEFALIEDLLATRLHSRYRPSVSNGQVLCLGSPMVFDLNPLNQRIYEDNLLFNPYEGCASQMCRVLVASFKGHPTPRSPHFPFPKLPIPTGMPTPSELMSKKK